MTPQTGRSPRLVIALSKGRMLKDTIGLLKRVGICPPGLSPEGRRLTFPLPNAGGQVILVRATDVPTYVEHGAADIGIVGHDLLLEQMRDVYVPLDLSFGACKIVLAEPTRKERYPSGPLRVATKYPNITERYFSEKGVAVEIIKLYGSIELAPSRGLADQIIDLTETGETLRLHRLRVIAELVTSSARLIVNRSSFRLKYPHIQQVIESLRKAALCE